MIWLVALGGALGSVSRYLMGSALLRVFGATFPTGTLLINVLGSLILGVVAGLAVDGGMVSPQARAFLAIGFCGGFTTFSAFSLETILLLESGQVARGTAYILSSVVLSVLAAWIGMIAARQMLTH